MERKIKIMLGSTVYGFENDLTSIVALLQQLGYDVLNSHAGTIKASPKLSNIDNCLRAVRECDLFLGIIRPYFGTGNIGDKNITFEEIKLAAMLKKPCWFLVHHDVDVMRRFLRKLTPKDASLKLLDVVDIGIDRNLDYRSVEIYDYVLQRDVPVANRTGNWVQEFYKPEEYMTFITTQFADTDFVKDILKSREVDHEK
ncbi:MAG: DUF4062 domain-containing protein [Prevotellaceae bacterium]|jgi:hypothetical protein|nr:DUF4062 domain-containing protein [Prevotellaceae bacterium]